MSMATGGGIGNGHQMKETKIIYHIDDEDTPYSVRLPIAPEDVTLRDFKNLLTLPKTNYKFFFKCPDDDYGIVKEEVIEDDAKLPIFKGRIVSYVVSADGSNISDSATSQVTELSASGRPSRRYQNHKHHAIDDDTSTCTESESVLSSRRCWKHPSGHRGYPHHSCDCSSSVMTSENGDSTTFVDSDDSDDDSTSRISSTTEDTSVSRIAENRRRRRRRRMPVMSSASSVSSVTDSSMSLNVITVKLNLDQVNYLGISIVGQSNKGIFVGSIMKGGAVALDGRIDPGDMILQVNNTNFERMSNDEAVQVLREAVKNPGQITLVVLKCWDSVPKGAFSIPRSEPVRPIDPGAWVAHTEAARQSGEVGHPLRPPSVSTFSSSTASSMCSSVAESSSGLLPDKSMLTLDHDSLHIVKMMASYESGLDIRDRMWLKMTIANAFLGSDVVDWLYNHVQGFGERRDAKKYAKLLLKEGLIKHTFNKGSFTEQCYYVFGDMITTINGVNGLRLEEDQCSERDTNLLLGQTGSPWHNRHQVAPFNGQMPFWAGDTVNYGVFGAQNGPAALVPPSETSSSEADRNSQLSGPFPKSYQPMSTFAQNTYHEPVFDPKPNGSEHGSHSNGIHSNGMHENGTRFLQSNHYMNPSHYSVESPVV